MPAKFLEMPDALLDLMTDVGTKWGTTAAGHVKLMVEQFTEVLKQSPKDGVTVRRGIAYGPYPRQMFDVFTPEGESAPRPAVVFVHGGAFLDGHPNRSEEIYSNVLHYFARHDMVGINMGYRLAGECKEPGASRDTAPVLPWGRAHRPEDRVDPCPNFLL